MYGLGMLFRVLIRSLYWFATVVYNRVHKKNIIVSFTLFHYLHPLVFVSLPFQQLKYKPVT